ncbi:SDR family oxidoreductase [Streptomyces lonarensis]|uniref:Sugar nucleotide-binding protein n=1 Tax=Streptomyces lonarensis TaxID=700599 RepID=A0A7X6CZH9_9ACTN|nr:sugar nucleotide-binding protein [Streptomyces lonarensis]NJQ05417.1 sugar nucleotide-binding protein [Streptomyces lonarensis]
MTLLIVGGSGFLGAELVRQATAAGHATVATYATKPVEAAQATWRALDLTKAAYADEVVTELRPRLIINAASNRDDWTVTAQAPIRLAMAAAQHRSRLVHVSSDAIFSGARTHYDLSCQPDPVTSYGAAKAAAETGVLTVHPEAVVARTSLIIGKGSSVHERLVHQLAAGSPGALYTDDIRCPVAVEDLAAGILELAESDASGIHHLAGADAVSRHELGVLIARRDGLDATGISAGLRAGSLPGGLDVRLDSRTTQQKLRTTLRGAREFCAEPA